MQALAHINDTLVQCCVRLHGLGGWAARLAQLPSRRGALSVLPPGLLGMAFRLAVHAAWDGLAH